jgi:hypothetical protein
VQQIRDELDRLAQAHIVGQAGPQAERAHAVEPAQAARLVRPQGGLKRRRGGQLGAGAFSQAFEQLGETAGGRDGRGQRTGLDFAGKCGLHGFAQLQLRRARGQASLDLAELARIDGDPSAAVAHERSLLLGERGELLQRQCVVTDRGLPIDREQLVER